MTDIVAFDQALRVRHLPSPSQAPGRTCGASDEQRGALAAHLTGGGGGDPEGFRLVYSLTHRRLYQICLDICRDPQTAEDALANTYLSVWRRCDTWDPARGSAMAWLSTIARNRAIDRLRCTAGKHLTDLADAGNIPDLEPDGEERLLRSERATQLKHLMDRLTEREQDVLRLAFCEGCTYSELAERVGVPYPTMKSTIRRALVRLSLDPDLAGCRTR